VSDGSASGTQLVKDINPGVAGSSITDLTASNGILYFSAQSPLRGRQLWRSDGTDAGTYIVKVINPTGSAQVSGLIDVNGLIFFRATDGVHGVELFRTDGTPAGTYMLKDINLGLTGFSSVNGKLFFVAYANENLFGRYIWMSDGTSAGTVQVTPTNNYVIYGGQRFYDVNGSAYFFSFLVNTTEIGLYRIDMSGNVSFVKPVPLQNSNGINIVRSGSLHFFLSDGYYWRTNGTTGGTYRLRTLCCGEGSEPFFLEDAGGTLYFVTTNPYGLWKTYGTAESTQQLEPNFIAEMEGLGNDLIYRHGDSHSAASNVWLADAETGAVTELSADATDPRAMTNAVDRVYFIANTPSNGRKLWVSDGTSAGTYPIHASPTPEFIAALGTKAIFSASGQIWVSDGTEAGTQFLASIDGGPQFFGQANGNVYFFAFTISARMELWKSDGTPAGTRMVKDVRPVEPAEEDNQDVGGGAAVGDWFYYSSIDPQGKHGIWRTDGTEAGTTEVTFFEPETEYVPVVIGPAGSNAFVIRMFESKTELWVTNGTTTTKLKTIDQEYQYWYAAKGNVIYIITRPGQFSPNADDDVWRSDGTISGTYEIEFQGKPYALRTSGDYVYLAGRADKEGKELFVIEESTAGSSNEVARVVHPPVTSQEDVMQNYPSPFGQGFTLTVAGEENTNFGLEVLSISGTRLHQAELPHNVSNQITTTTWPDGMYMMKVKSGNKVIARKVMKVSK
jgi:ELWxxDGT repeat protein